MSNINELLNKAINFKEPVNCHRGSGCPFKKHACLMKHEGNPVYLWNKDCYNGKDCVGNGKICELKHPESRATFFVDKRQNHLPRESRPFIPLLPIPPYPPGVDNYEPPLHNRSSRRERSRSRERDYDRRDDRRDYDRREDRRDYDRRDDRCDYDRR